ncbi:tRNA dimethylallyltransferase [Arcticibacter tournemirensis]|uniref:tRNA dimethylallyltransferase n=1 Tax=Arcticibacter tournemirensis TaxID=699437 RepID=A0A5M9H7P4_9SPHI|nr:tRNA (adenosine(37)-N6)-dimethylallyltransferase MiaA [Arcticibacter tournemirensis]KAA8482205.1 tRNA (adenosine(37)-N6)-dimethylallyltransferase MiaA [Arcticibacter tournemirensis]TQM52343.1 tRNA dimethylallyltransferase [Arcticibacter tournemirensis]
MTDQSNKKLIVIAGPTAIGKTELAIRVALHFKTEVLSADSRQFYREMSIGTAKPSLEELRAVKHHFIDSLSITENYSAGDFEDQGLNILADIFSKNDYAVLAGGSGLFIKAITEGFDELPKADAEVRNKLNQILAEQGIGVLQQQLKELDPEYYRQADIHNPQRIIRALEVSLSTGKPFSSLHLKKKRERPFSVVKIGLNADRDLLYQRINHRVDLMVEAGLIDEVKQLLPYRHLNALNTVGYSEIFSYLDGEISLQEALDAIKQNTRRFAKRQLTWFRKDPDIKWFKPDEQEAILEYIH